MSRSRELSQPVEAESGERVLLGTRRPDGTIRKERRIRAGYTPQEEQPLYQSKGVLARQNVPVCPGMDPGLLEEAKQALTKNQKKNEKRKEKKDQEKAAGPAGSSGSSSQQPAGVASATAQMAKLSVAAPAASPAPQAPAASAEPEDPKAAAERALRALRKKVRQAEGLVEKQKGGGALTAEEQAKADKLQSWLDEVAALEKQVAELS